jgi:hypothetical protein
MQEVDSGMGEIAAIASSPYSAGTTFARTSIRSADFARYRPSEQPQWIDYKQRVGRGVGVQVQPPVNSDRITLNIPPDPRIVVSEIVVVEVGLLVEVLPRQS